MTEQKGSPDGALIRVLGVDVRLRTEREAVLGLIRNEWARCLAPEGDTAGVAHPPREIAVDAMPERSLGYDLATAVTRLAIEASIGRLLMFHAAGLADQAGHVLMLVAPSGTGKTTAVAALCRSRFGYVSDETVAIDADHRVFAYPKPLSVLEGEAPKVQRSPDDLGLMECPTTLSIHRVVLLDRAREGHVPPTLERLGLLDALTELIAQTSSLFALDRPLQRLCALSEACGGVYRLAYSEILDAEDLLVALGDDGSGVPGAGAVERWTAIGLPMDDDSAAVGTTGGGFVSRGPVLDAVQVEDEALVLVGNVPIRLGPLGLTLWRAADHGATEESLIAAAVRAHGTHPDATLSVRAAVREMRRAGLLT